MPKRVLIVDDEPLARSAMRRLLAAHPDVEILGEADSTETARAHIASLQPDLIFLDIELGGGRDGFDLLDAPVERVTNIDVPMPYSPALEKLVLPNADRIKAAIRAVCYK